MDMKPYALRKPEGFIIDEGFIDEVKRISLRRRGLLDDDDLL